MKEKQLRIAISGVPRYHAVFKIEQVPERYACALRIGDLVYWNEFRAQMVKVKNSMCFQVQAEHVGFITYMTTIEMQEAINAN